MIALVFDFLVLLLYLYPQLSHLVWCKSFGPSNPPHQVYFTGDTNVLPHFGQPASFENSFN